MTTKRWIGGSQAIRWQETYTPAFGAGDVYTLSINRKEITVTVGVTQLDGVTVTTAANIVDAWVAAIQDSNEPEWQEIEIIYPVEDDDVSTHLTLAGPEDGSPIILSTNITAFTVSVSVTTAGSAGQNEIQRVALPGTATGGTFTLTFDGQTTGNLTYDESAADIETALEGLTTVPDIDDVTVTGSAGGPWLVEFKGNLANTNVGLMTGDGASITKGASAYPIIVTTAVHGDAGLNEKQYVSLPGPPTGGTFTLSFDGQTTAAIDYDETAANVETALEALSNITAGDVIVTGNAGGPYTIEFDATYGNTDVSLIVADGTSLTGAAAVSVVTTVGGTPATNDTYTVGIDGSGSHVIAIENHLGVADGTSLAFPCTAETFQEALSNLANVGWGNVRVTDNAVPADGMTFVVEFIGDLAGHEMESFSMPADAVVHVVTGGTAGVNEVQRVSLTGGPIAGTFTLTFRGQTTAAIALDAAAATVEAALEALSTITVDDLTVTGTGPWVVTFGGTLAAQDLPGMTGTGTSLTGGTVSVGTSQAATAATNEVQVVTVYGAPAGGTFTLTYDSETTDAVNFDATAAEIETALEANANIDAVTVVGDAGGPWTVTFGGDLGGTNLLQMTGTDVDLSGAVVAIDVTQGATDIADEVQVITLDGAPTGGTFTLTFDGETTGAVAYNASATVVQSALEAISTIDVGEIVVSGSAGGPWTVLFQGGLAGTNVALITGTGTNLTGVDSQEVTISACQAPRGPNWLDDADNWSDGVAPADGDALVFELGNVSCLYGLDAVLIVTLTGSPTGGTFDLTYRGQTAEDIAYDATAATIATALNALGSLAEDAVSITGSAGGPWTIWFHGFPTSADGTIQLSADNAGLTGGSSPDVTIAATYPTFNVRAKASYTGPIGLPPSNGSYPEYRPQRLKTGISGDSLTIDIGEGVGAGSGMIRLDTGAADVTMTIYGTGSQADDLIPAVEWVGTGSSNAIMIYRGSFGAALLETDSGAIDTLDMGYVDDQDADADVRIGAKCTIATITKYGGVLYVGGRSGTAVTALTNTSGNVTIDGTDDVDALTMSGGRCYYNTTGTLGGNTVLSGGAILDVSRNLAAKTITNAINVYGDVADVYDPEKVIASLVVDYNYSTRQAGLGSNVRITRGATA